MSEGSRLYLMAYDIEQDLVQSAVFVTETARKHVEDMLGALDEDQAQNIRKISQDLSLFFKDCSQITRNRNYLQYDEIKARKKQLLEEIENLIARQAKGIKNETYSARNSILVFNILLETKDLISISARLVKMYCRLEKIIRRWILFLLSLQKTNFFEMRETVTSQLFDLNHTLFPHLFQDEPWRLLNLLENQFDAFISVLPNTYFEWKPGIWLAENVSIAPTAFIEGPAIIGPNTEIRHGAFIRKMSLLGMIVSLEIPRK